MIWMNLYYHKFDTRMKSDRLKILEIGKLWEPLDWSSYFTPKAFFVVLSSFSA